ncbi:hypothetical protein Sya03_49650 [Spirilliplanes yamanashiensis]|uniref:Uncharacterized protein n=1 Tax=Spirilliplanes yamanashiensis TaxID=42233 RepID=A0A8J3YBN6_9ACTN|nr:hypothetical protein Sya03_49650 [Spirilliplanes yamanashiensis]
MRSRARPTPRQNTTDRGSSGSWSGGSKKVRYGWDRVSGSGARALPDSVAPGGSSVPYRVDGRASPTFGGCSNSRCDTSTVSPSRGTTDGASVLDSPGPSLSPGPPLNTATSPGSSLRRVHVQVRAPASARTWPSA